MLCIPAPFGHPDYVDAQELTQVIPRQNQAKQRWQGLRYLFAPHQTPDGRWTKGVTPNQFKEYLDPLHRNFEPAFEVMEAWKCSENSSFYEWLEGRSLDLSEIQYCTTDHRRDYAVSFRAGILYDNNGEVLDTGSYQTTFSGRGMASFVLGVNDTLYVGDHILGRFHHSSFLAGGRVFCAGEIRVQRGKSIEVTNKSGHYHTSSKHMLNMLKYFKKNGVDLENVTVRLFVVGIHGILTDITGNPLSFLFHGREFLERGGDLNPIELPTSWSLNHYLAWSKKLSSSSTDLALMKTQCNEFGDTPFHFAAQKGDFLWFRQRIGSIDLFDTCNVQGETPFMVAIKYGQIEIVRDLLKEVGFSEQTDKKKNTYLHLAILSNNPEMCRLILNSFPGQFMMKNDGGETPSLLACRISTKGVINTLKSHSWPPHSNTTNGNTWMHYLAENTAFSEELDELADYKCTVRSTSGETFVHRAAFASNLHLLSRLYSTDPSRLYDVDLNGNTPLHHAVMSKNRKQMGAILFFRTVVPGMVNCKNRDGLTPLELARNLKNDHALKRFAFKIT